LIIAGLEILINTDTIRIKPLPFVNMDLAPDEN
jgi:hypothetical protein